MDRGNWRATVYGVAKSRAQLSTSATDSVIFLAAIKRISKYVIQRTLFKKKRYLIQPPAETKQYDDNKSLA